MECVRVADPGCIADRGHRNCGDSNAVRSAGGRRQAIASWSSAFSFVDRFAFGRGLAASGISTTLLRPPAHPRRRRLLSHRHHCGVVGPPRRRTWLRSSNRPLGNVVPCRSFCPKRLVGVVRWAQMASLYASCARRTHIDRQRSASSLFLSAPRMLRTARHTCRTIVAGAPATHPHIAQRTLLVRKTQKPIFRRRAEREAVSQAPATVATIAGH